MTLQEGARHRAYGQDYRASVLDRFGVWLSARQIRCSSGSLSGKCLGDFGSGYHAKFIRSVLPELREAVVIDFALTPKVQNMPRVATIEGHSAGNSEPGSNGKPGHRSLHIRPGAPLEPVDRP
jgi:hypothetical protein